MPARTLQFISDDVQFLGEPHSLGPFEGLLSVDGIVADQEHGVVCLDYHLKVCATDLSSCQTKRFYFTS